MLTLLPSSAVRRLAPFILSGSVAAVAHGAPVEFNRDIRPILSDKCFGCHGPDSGHRKAGLRLDVREAALKPAKSGEIPLKPGDLEGSHLLQRILSTDVDEVMPPPEAKMAPLTQREKDLVKRWISEGAAYQPLWSFIGVKPVALPPAPAGVSPEHLRSPIDRLLFARLAARNLHPRPEARPETLLRRASLDLTGLPPSAEAVRSFLADRAPGAYERAVDKLLASPAFGERLAVDWLDLARYSDSYGFQVDRDREAWPWRDWVVDAFNRNLPFNQFVTWQLAGDLLPNPTEEQVLATAFNRLHQQESEGGSIEEEYRVEYVADRVQTFATTFLGLTFECAKCHDHKFDPITQKEFYQMFAFFDDIDEAGLYSFFTGDAPTPAIRLLSADGRTQAGALARTVAEAEAQLPQSTRTLLEAFPQWLVQRPAEMPLPGELVRLNFNEAKAGKVPNSADPAKPASIGGENKLVPGRAGQVLQLSGDDAFNLPAGSFNRPDPFTVSLWLQAPELKERAVVFHRSKAWTDAASRGFELLLEGGHLKWSLIRFWPGDAASIRTLAPIKPGEWLHVSVSSDGSGKAAGLQIYLNGRAAGTEVLKDSLSRDHNPGRDNITIGERMRDRGFKNGLVDEVRVFNRRLSDLELEAVFAPAAAAALWQKPVEALSAQERERLQGVYLGQHAEHAKALETVRAARVEQLKFLEGQKEIMVMQELPKPKKAYILARGEYAQRGEEVFAGTPAALPAFPKDAPPNRLGLAQWLTAPEHPLLARVTVNRFWQGLFGRGLVRSAEDFGSQGTQPEYPELLDWLAGEFVRSGWDTKALFRTIVLSHAYRQESTATADLMADDPDNVLLARGPRFRLSAEALRDTFLFASGLLSPKMGGAPVHPYEAADAFRPTAPDKGEGSLRRSLYTRWRRTSPPPAMMAFDASRRAVCSARRERTNTPLQALVLLNGPQYVEAARVLGTRLSKAHGGNLDAMIEEAFLTCLSRSPDAREREIVQGLYTDQLSYFRAHPQEAAALLKVGQAPAEPAVPAAEAAAATVLAQALLNHDASVVKQ
jgi:hypothetical protein